jgi:hypothetical protein
MNKSLRFAKVSKLVIRALFDQATQNLPPGVIKDPNGMAMKAYDEDPVFQARVTNLSLDIIQVFRDE